jgi:hypothetical protein
MLSSIGSSIEGVPVVVGWNGVASGFLRSIHRVALQVSG